MFKEIEHYFCTPDKNIDYSKTKEKYLSLFVTAFLGMLVALLPCMIKNHGVFTYYGDFNTQQLMFWTHMHEMVRNGNLGWDWGTDLGTGVVNGWATFLGNPFFLMILPFPTSWVVYLMPWILCLKVALAAIFAYAYLRRFVKNKDAAFIGAMLYAYSGFQTYNVFFNQFHEIVALFPLLLLALELNIKEDKHLFLALVIAFTGFIGGGFFLICEFVFTLIYFILRCMDKDFCVSWRKFLNLVLESVIGGLIVMVFLLPASLSLLGNWRIGRKFSGLDFVLYEKTVIPRIFQAFFTLPDMCSRVNIFPSDSARWASLAGYLPLFSMCGVIAYYIQQKQNNTHDWLCKALILFTIMACVPILNSAFILFNNNYYARWFYMPILLFCLMTAKVLDDNPELLRKGFPITAICGVVFLAVGALPKYENGKYVFFKTAAYPKLYHIQVVVTLLMILLLGLLIYLGQSKRFNKKINFMHIALILTIVSCIICNTSEVYYGVNEGRTAEPTYVDMAINGGKKIDIPKLESKSQNYNENNNFFRIDTSQNRDNFCMFWRLSSMRCFHSTVSPSILNFYQSIGHTRDVASRIDYKFYPLRAMLSVKYYFKKNYGGKPLNSFNDLLGFHYVDTQNTFDIYENENYIPMGFAYDCYTTDDEIKKAEKLEKTHILMKALVLDSNQITSYYNIISKYNFQKSDYTYDAYKQNCNDRRAESCYSFKYNTHGFTGKIKLDKSKLVFFSVPFEKGWSAKVNGKPVKVEKVDYGFMAVCVPAGDSEIVFKYYPEGQTAGIIFTIIGILLFVVCMLYYKFIAKKIPKK